MEIRKAVEEHQVDFGFTSSPFGDLDSKVLLMDHMVSVGREAISDKNPISLYENTEGYILCRAGHETVMEKLKGHKINLERSFIVQQAETVINLVKEGNGTGVISELVLNATPNDLYRHPIYPAVEMEVGIVANDLEDLTPVATVLLQMIERECEEYSRRT